MMSAERMGEKSGLFVGDVITPTNRFPAAWMARIAHQALREKGIAHIDPEPEFVRGFVHGMELAAMYRNFPSLFPPLAPDSPKGWVAVESASPVM